MNPKLQKIDGDMEKIRQKIAVYQSRLRELEHRKTEAENAGIIALVRDMDISHDDFEDFILEYKERQSRAAVPDMDKSLAGAKPPHINETEDTPVEN